MPGTSRHESGFALDIYISGAATLGEIDPISRVEVENIALMNNLSPIDRVGASGLFPGVKKGTSGTFESPIIYDGVHFQANPKSYGYSSMGQAIRENQADYKVLNGLQYEDSLYDSFYLFSTSAGGGFVLYSNKTNTNMTQSVYAK